MRSQIKSTIAVGLFYLALFAPAGAAWATPPAICTQVPRFGWVSAEQIEEQLRREGFNLLRMRISNESCFIALVETMQGQQYELRIHPANGALLGPPEQPPPARIRR